MFVSMSISVIYIYNLYLIYLSKSMSVTVHITLHRLPQDSRWPLALQLLSDAVVNAAASPGAGSGAVAMYNAALAAVEDWTQAVQLMMEMQRGGAVDGVDVLFIVVG